MLIAGPSKADFNPHLRVGGDCEGGAERWRTAADFNPHLRVGGDVIIAYNRSLVIYFNPHLRVGGDNQ